MASYFDHNDATDAALIHPSVRTHESLSFVADAVEHEIIQVYTFQVTGNYNPGEVGRFGNVSTANRSPYYYPSEDYVVWLAGYRPDSSDALTGTLLKEALRRTIASVITHRLFNLDNVGGSVIEERRGRRAIKYAEQRDSSWPDSWDSLLIPFDLRPKYAI